MASSYKNEKVAFVSGMSGSSVGHVNLVSAVALASIALYSALRSRLPTNKSLGFPAEWLLLVTPLLLSVTLFANSPGLLSLILLFPTALLMLIPRRELGTPLPSNVTSPNRGSNSEVQATKSLIPQLPALTTYRSHMILMTVLSILAVDFPVFPRSLAKCETYGVSLMDLGVGSFVFSQGVVSAIPILKSPTYLSSPFRPKIVTALRKSFPVLCLGLLRVLFVKGAKYPEHETEYGVHWNFFITLAALPVLQVLLHPLLEHLPVAMVGALVAVSHQFALSSGMRDYVFDAPRTNLISANKEGIVSLTGYLAIHLFGLSTGTVLLPPSPSYFRRQKEAQEKPRRRDSNATRPSQQIGQRENDKTATELCSYAILWWAFYGMSHVAKIEYDVSRRLVNLPYVLWISAFNVSFILGYILLDLYFFPSPLSKSVYSPTSKLKVQPRPDNDKFPIETQQAGASPVLLEAINKNGLSVFLIANVATGLINMSFQTMYMSDRWAMVILSGYGLGVCLIAWFIKDRRLWKL